MEVPDIYKHRIKGHTSTFYVPNFITEAEEEYLTRKIVESSQHKWKNLANRRLQLWGGEVTPNGILLSQPMPSFVDKYPDIISRLRDMGAFQNSPHGAPNHIILNEYLPGQGIMPHQDGPRYHPVVATISLGSHCVFHYYQYKTEDGHVTKEPSSVPDGEGKSIDSTPVLSVLLERRSVVISSGYMYTDRLHGIQEAEEDFINCVPAAETPMDSCSRFGIGNFDLLGDEDMKQAIEKGEPLKRETRYSLTCRDVGRVSKANHLFCT
ncbi:hypothetical protein BDQ12DRAFT_634403 [Crucibulum laeve]|uniref:Fe2OG dioxygenase domain-containing protein n=1 Tax=Crucibulum laeve TaxID=68775 RepID=A0A5C3LSE6_9AGAR|nr:hypothetical protein BDQ12DRAFT_634403 [Crucibulum laeve]